MIASTHLAVSMLLLLSTSPAATGNDPEQSESVRWVRSPLKNDLEEIARSTHLPFQFRTTSRDKRCEGWTGNTFALIFSWRLVSSRPTGSTRRRLPQARHEPSRSWWPGSYDPDAGVEPDGR